MKNLRSLVALILIIIQSSCEAQIPNENLQIAEAVMAAPEEKRAEATVMGFDEKNELVIIREGSNELICLSDDPLKEGFSVSCYHRDLEPFMARGRVLKAEGKSRGEIFEIRAREVKSGALKMPTSPSTLQVLSGSEGKYDFETGEVVNANLRYVVYIPYATQESTGLPIRPLVPGGAWLMDPGTHRAHIMITPNL